MKVTLNLPQEFDAKYFEVRANVRHWEDSTINEVNDTEQGDKMPCRIEDEWCPRINIDSGIIENWEKGKTANIHYKVVDMCSFGIINEQGEIIFKQENDYVPRILCPKENGYGDYIIMDISEDGTIQNWNKHKLFEIINNN